MEALAISDIHLERRGLLDVPPLNESFDVLICAATLGRDNPRRLFKASWISREESPRSLSQETMISTRVSSCAKRRTARMGRRAKKIVTVLSADNPVCEIEQVRFIGLTLWSDWSVAGHWMTDAANGIELAARARAEASDMKTAPREYGAIRTERGAWPPYDAVAEHAREKAILLDELVCTHDGPTVVVTHPPSTRCVRRRVYRPSASLVGAGILRIRYPPNFTRSNPTRRLDLWSCSRAVRRTVG
jgi:hypothetical protein